MTILCDILNGRRGNLTPMRRFIQPTMENVYLFFECTLLLTSPNESAWRVTSEISSENSVILYVCMFDGLCVCVCVRDSEQYHFDFENAWRNIFIRNLNGLIRVCINKIRKWNLLIGAAGPIKLFSQFKCLRYTHAQRFIFLSPFVVVVVEILSFWCQNDTNYDRYGVTKFTMEFYQYLFEILAAFLSPLPLPLCLAFRRSLTT